MSILEQTLVERLRLRDERAFAELVRLYQNQVFTLAYRMLGDRGEAEDLAQEVFLQVLRSIVTFRGESKLSTWIYRIAVNQCYNRRKYLGRRGHQTNSELDTVDEAGATHAAGNKHATPDAALEGAQLEEALRQALTKLDEEHRVVVILRDIEDMSYEEIAAVTGLADGTVKSRLHRGRMALKQHLERLWGKL